MKMDWFVLILSKTMLLRNLAINQQKPMKFLYLSIFLLALSCGGVKTETKKEPKKITKTKKEIIKPKIEDEKLLVVLKNSNNLTDVKALITNSGLTWDAIAYENKTTKIGVIKVPSDKTDFWIDRLKNSGQFTTVDTHKKKTLDALIKKAEMAFFTFRKSACFGDCPVYNVSIDSEGNVSYNGLKYVTVTGKKNFTLTEKEFTTLKKKLANNNFSEYKKIYDDANLMDLPSTFITYKDKQVQIRLWKQIPKNLVDVHEYVQGILRQIKKYLNSFLYLKSFLNYIF